MKIIGNLFAAPGPLLPQPPKRTLFVKEGTMAENDGKIWILIRQYAGYGDSYKTWKSYEAWSEAQK